MFIIIIIIIANKLLHLKSKIMRWAGHVAHMGRRRGAYRILVGKPEGRTPIGRPRHTWRIILKRIFRKENGRGHGLD